MRRVSPRRGASRAQLSTHAQAPATTHNEQPSSSAHHLCKLLALQAEVDARVCRQHPRRQLLEQLQRGIHVPCRHAVARLLPQLHANRGGWGVERQRVAHHAAGAGHAAHNTRLPLQAAKPAKRQPRHSHSYLHVPYISRADCHRAAEYVTGHSRSAVPVAVVAQVAKDELADQAGGLRRPGRVRCCSRV